MSAIHSQSSSHALMVISANIEGFAANNWHWMWLESGKPNTGFIYQIMKCTRHQYHYAVRRCKSNKLNIQKQRLAENIHNSTNL